MDRVEFGEWVTARRVLNGLSREDLADQLGISLRTLGSWERGDNGGALRKRAKIEKVLGPVEVFDLNGPTLSEALASLRIASANLDKARDILYALRSSE